MSGFIMTTEEILIKIHKDLGWIVIVLTAIFFAIMWTITA